MPARTKKRVPHVQVKGTDQGRRGKGEGVPEAKKENRRDCLLYNHNLQLLRVESLTDE